MRRTLLDTVRRVFFESLTHLFIDLRDWEEQPGKRADNKARGQQNLRCLVAEMVGCAEAYGVCLLTELECRTKDPMNRTGCWPVRPAVGR